MKMKYLITVVILLFSVGSFAQKPSEEYKIKKFIPVPGNGSWDYLTVDNAQMKIYIAHGDCVNVVDLKTGKEAGTVSNTPGAHGVALAPEFNKGFVSAGKIDSLIVFDMKTLRLTGKIPAGKNPDAILYDPFSQQVFAFNAGSNSITVIRAENDSVVATVRLRGNPKSAVTDNSGYIYVNLESLGMVSRIDAQTLQVTGMFPVGPNKKPTGLALDKQNNILFVGCSGTNELAILDIGEGNVKQTLPIGMHCDGVCFLPAQRDIFTSNGEGSITLIRQNAPDRYSKIQTIITKKGARTIACNPASKSVYTVTQDYDDERKEYKPDSFQLIVVGK